MGGWCVLWAVGGVGGGWVVRRGCRGGEWWGGGGWQVMGDGWLVRQTSRMHYVRLTHMCEHYASDPDRGTWRCRTQSRRHTLLLGMIAGQARPCTHACSTMPHGSVAHPAMTTDRTRSQTSHIVKHGQNQDRQAFSATSPASLACFRSWRMPSCPFVDEVCISV